MLKLSKCLPWILGAAWTIALMWLMIAPVWDETIFYGLVAGQAKLSDALIACWTSFPLYRPLMTSFLAIILKILPFDLAWPVLRVVNMLLVVAAFSALLRAAKILWAERYASDFPAQVTITYWLAIFASPAVLIVGGWYANLFDAGCFFFMACGVLAYAYQRAFLAGILFGIAWFCKEAAVFIAPLLVYLYIVFPARRHLLWRALGIYLLLGVVYWSMRSMVVPLGSQHDVHALSLDFVLPAMKAVIVRMWMPGVSAFPAVVGILASLLVLVAARNWLFAGLALAVFLAATVVYAGMLPNDAPYATYPLIGPTIFAARLFYIPAGILLFGLLLVGRPGPYLCVALIYAMSLPLQFSWQEKFQLAYRNVYALGDKSVNEVLIQIPKNSGVQAMPKFRNVIMADVPDADYLFNDVDGSLSKFFKK